MASTPACQSSTTTAPPLFRITTTLVAGWAALSATAAAMLSRSRCGSDMLARSFHSPSSPEGERFRSA